MLYLLWVFKEKTAWVVFLTVFLLSAVGFKVFTFGGEVGIPLSHRLLGFFYSLLLGVIFTCLYRSLKEKFLQVWREKQPHRFWWDSMEAIKGGNYGLALKTFLGGLVKFLVLLLGILGLGAAQFCVLGSPVCSFSVGTAIVTAIFPSALVGFLYEYGQIIILTAVAVQIAGLFLMGCFKKVTVSR